MRRRPGTIIPLEATILTTAIDLAKAGTVSFHGFQLAKHLRDDASSKKLTAHGTLYKALTRMEKAGLLESEWEDPYRAADQGRPRRRLYSITANGRVAFANWEADLGSAVSSPLDPGITSS